MRSHGLIVEALTLEDGSEIEEESSSTAGEVLSKGTGSHWALPGWHIKEDWRRW